MRDAADRQVKINALTERYALGEISEDVFTASVKSMLPNVEIRYILHVYQPVHRQSLPYKRGMV